MKTELTQSYLKECLDYNPDTGIFVWKKRPLSHFRTEHGMNISNSQCENKPAGVISNGYLLVRINDKLLRCHRLAWLYVYGVMPEKFIDHVNGIKTDNRICNLRLATNGENMQNLKTAMVSNKSSGLLGVSFDKRRNKFRARIRINYKEKGLGYFKTPEEAHTAYLNAKRELHSHNTI